MHDHARVYVEGPGEPSVYVLTKISGFKLQGGRPIEFELYQFLM